MWRLGLQGDKLTVGVGAGGRGAWLCPRIECFELATKRRAFSRAFRTEVPIGATEALRTAILTATTFPLDGSFVKR